MRNIFLLLCVLSLCTTLLFPQIPNPGFENWTSDSPDNWITSNSGSFINVTKSSIAHSGSSSVRGDVVLLSPTTFVLQPVLQSGTDGLDFSYTQRPGALTGYYVYFPSAGSGDQFYVYAILYKGGQQLTPIGTAVKLFTASASSFTQFNAPFTYLTAGNPDTCIIQIQIIGPASGGQPHQGSYFMLDDLAFGAATSISAEGSSTPFTFQLVQNYPNPFNPSTSISFEVPTPSHINLKVFNVLGAEAATLVDAGKEAGRYTVNWNAAGLPSGVYLYQLTALTEKGDLLKETRRAILLK
jgi:hypothetical protein